MRALSVLVVMLLAAGCFRSVALYRPGIPKGANSQQALTPLVIEVLRAHGFTPVSDRPGLILARYQEQRGSGVTIGVRFGAEYLRLDHLSSTGFEYAKTGAGETISSRYNSLVRKLEVELRRRIDPLLAVPVN